MLGQAKRDGHTVCSTKVAPWYVIPANRKWFRDLAVGEILADVLEGLDPQYPARAQASRCITEIPDCARRYTTTSDCSQQWTSLW